MRLPNLRRIRLLLVAFVACLAAIASAQDNPLRAFTTRHEISTAVDTPLFVRAADFDKDGDVDVLSVGSGGVIRLLLSNGAALPLFEEITIATNPQFVWTIAVGDIDLDGDTDVVSGGTGDVVWLHENVGGAQAPFSTRALESVNLLRFVEIVDMNSDGLPDIVAASSGDNMIRILLQSTENPGEFQTVVVSAEVIGAQSLGIADFDGDSHLDIVAGGFGDTVRWLENVDGSATAFTLHEIDAPGVGATGGMAVAVVDINDDERPDVLSAWANGSGVNLHRNLGGDPPLFETLEVGLSPLSTSVSGGDIDGDGLVDVVSASSENDGVYFWRNLGTETLSFAREGVTSGANKVTSISLGDMDGDDDLDIVSGSTFDDAIRWYRNDSNVSPRIAFRKESLIGGLGHPNGVAVADIDGSGRRDVVSVELFTGFIRIFRNKGGDPPAWGLMSVPPAASQPNQVLAADLNNDDQMDLLVNEAGLHWRRNDGGEPPSFTEFTVTNDIVGAANIVDFDNDSDPDIVVNSGSNIRLFRHNGAQQPDFSSEVIISTGMSAAYSAAADIDGDGDVDIVAGSTSELRWYERISDEPLTFQVHSISTSIVGSMTHVALADFDLDGDVDIAVGRSNAAIAWHENDGEPSGGFTEHLINPSGGTGFAVETVQVVDLDNDGHQDILTAVEGGDAIRWHRFDATAPSKFETHIVSTNAECTWVAFGDLNGDGQIDIAGSLILGPGAQDEVAWFENLFRLPADLNDDGAVNGGDLAALLSGWGPDGGFGADLNGDGIVNGADLAMLLASWTG